MMLRKNLSKRNGKKYGLMLGYTRIGYLRIAKKMRIKRIRKKKSYLKDGVKVTKWESDMDLDM